MARPSKPLSQVIAENTPSPDVLREFNDRGTLWLLENPRNAQQLLHIVQPEIAQLLDFDDAQRINRSFIPPDLQKRESDLIFRVTLAKHASKTAARRLVWLYFLMEHQSKPDAWMVFRVLTYLLEIWQSLVREWLDSKPPCGRLHLPVVIPLVFYTGKKRWKGPLELKSLVDLGGLPDVLGRFVPSWETLFLNLSETPLERLQEVGGSVGPVLSALQAEEFPMAELEGRLREALSGLEGLSLEEEGEWLRAVWYLFQLVFHRRSVEESEVLQGIIKEEVGKSKFRVKGERKKMVTAAQEYERRLKAAERAAERAIARTAQTSLKQGRDEGRAEGAERTQRKAVQSVLETRFGKLPRKALMLLNRADTETLTHWLPIAVTAPTLEEAVQQFTPSEAVQ